MALPMAPGFYILTHQPSGCYYVGSTNNLRQRLAAHRSAIRQGNHENRKVREVFTNLADVEFTTATAATIEDARQMEQDYLDQCHGQSRCCNTGNSSTAAWVAGSAPQEAIERARQLGLGNTGRVRSAETRARMSAAKIGNPNMPPPALAKGVSINGVRYSSVRLAAQALGRDRRTVLKRINSSAPEDSEWTFS